MVESITAGIAANLSLSPDGRTLAVTLLRGGFAGGLALLSVPDLRPVRTVDVPIGTVGRFSPDGRTLLYGTRDGRILALETRTWRPRGRPLVWGAAVLETDLSPDGRLLVATSADGAGRIWDLASGRPVGAPLSGDASDVIDVAFLRRGGRVAVLHQRGGVAWDLRPASWARRACVVAGRTLTEAEWARALPGHAYTPACADR